MGCKSADSGAKTGGLAYIRRSKVKGLLRVEAKQYVDRGETTRRLRGGVKIKIKSPFGRVIEFYSITARSALPSFLTHLPEVREPSGIGSGTFGRCFGNLQA